MTENPVSISISASVGDALQVLQNLDVRHLPVINEAREVVGMLSDRDLRAIAVPRTIDEQWLGMRFMDPCGRVTAVRSR